MRKKILLRLGLVGVVAAASSASAFAVGCSSSSSSPVTPTDSGADATEFPDTGADSQTGLDSGGDAADAAPPPNAKLTLVHAGPGIPAFRVCFGLINAGAVVVAPGFYPLPNNHLNQGPFPYLGIFPGTGGTLADLGVNYDNLEIQGYIVNAEAIAANTDSNTNELDCSHLIGSDGAGVDGGGLVLGRDYFALPPIPKGTLTPSSSFFLILEGCVPGITSSSAAAVCGSSYSASTGNIGLAIYQADNSTPAATTLGVQVIHAASAWDGVTSAELEGQAISNTFRITDEAIADGGGNAPIATTINFGAGITPDAAAPQTVVPTDYASLGATITVTAPDGGPLLLGLQTDGGPLIGPITPPAISFPEIQALSGYSTAPDGGVAGPLYLPGSHFVLIWVGDPSQSAYIGADGGPLSQDAGGQFNTAYPHFLMFPSDPVLPASN
jgi:hypothetical protein